MNRRQLALEIATEASPSPGAAGAGTPWSGFDLVGIAPLAPPPAAAHFDTWIAAGRHGSMDYLERQRERIVDPQRILPSGRSLLVVGLGHSRAAVELETSGGPARVARYAAGRDYHNLIGKRLAKLSRRLEAEGFAGPHRKVVDAGPLLERSHASAAGLGFESKAANLLSPQLGPWFFLGELILGEELEPTPAPTLPNCGSCTACLDACPTAAIVAPGEVDARRCISYLTIEHRGPIDRELRTGMGPWVFGCDVCSEVCPWGKDAPDLSARFGDHPGLASTEQDSALERWLAPSFEPRAELGGSPLQRPKREGLARNAAIALGNLPSERGQAALVRALEDESPVVREAAAWGLMKSAPSTAIRASVEDAARVEQDLRAAREMQRSLSGEL